MPVRLRSLVILAILLAVLFGLAPSVRADSADERLFFFYALEDMYRATRPGHRRVIKSSLQVKRFLAARRLMAERLRRQIETGKLDDDLARCYKDYLDLLKKVEPLIDQLEAKENEYYSHFHKLRQGVLTTAQLSQAETTLQTLNSAADAMAASWRNPFNDAFDTLGHGIFAGLSAAVMGNMRHRLRMTLKIRQAKSDARRYEQENYPRLQRDIQKAADEFFKSFDREQAIRVAAATRRLRDFPDKYGWSSTETEFNPNREAKKWSAEDQPRNPFRIKALALEELDRNLDDSDARATLQLARELVDSIASYPSGNSPAYLRYKAEVYYLAGHLANRAARLEIGHGGFKDARSKPAEAAAFSQRVWKLYAACEKRDALEQADVLHQRVLAFAYGGNLKTAFALLERTPLQQLPCGNPDFWVDLARFLSLAGDTLQKSCERSPALRQNPTVQLQLAKFKADTMYCLTMAVYTGLKSTHDLETHADLQWARDVHGSEINSMLKRIDR